jgi:hypothetical protein
MGGYRALPEPLAVISQMANSAKLSRAMMCGRLYLYDALLQRLAQHLEDMPPPIRPIAEIVYGGARHGRVVTNAVRAPVRPATRWRHVVSRASARLMAGRMVVSRRASIDFPAPGGPSIRTFGSERLHHLQLYHSL